MISLLARLGLDTSGFATGLARAEGIAKKTGASIGNSMRGAFVGVFGTAAITASIKSVMDYGGKIADLRQKTLISTDALQEFDYMAQQTGTSLEAFVDAEKKLAITQQEAIKGSKDLREVFARFGLSVSDLKKLSPHQLFRLLASAIGNSELTGRELSDVIKLMGRSADNVLPAMKQGFEGMIERAHKLGLVLTEDVINKLDEAGDRMNEAKLRMRGPAASLAMFGVEKAEESGAIAAGFSAAWQHAKRGFSSTDNRSFAQVYSSAVDAYNARVMNSVGAQSLIPNSQAELERIRETLDRIERNQRESPDGL